MSQPLSAERLAAVGVPAAVAAALPLAAVWSAGIAGFSAAGITSGLSAIAFGAGMVPGIGVAVLVGLVSFWTLRTLMGRGQRQRVKEAKAAFALRMSEALQNLNAARDAAELRSQMLAGQPDVNGEVLNERKYLARLMQAMDKVVLKLEEQLRVHA